MLLDFFIDVKKKSLAIFFNEICYLIEFSFLYFMLKICSKAQLGYILEFEFV